MGKKKEMLDAQMLNLVQMVWASKNACNAYGVIKQLAMHLPTLNKAWESEDRERYGFSSAGTHGFNGHPVVKLYVAILASCTGAATPSEREWDAAKKWCRSFIEAHTGAISAGRD